MTKELPPQFYDEKGDKQCPSCISPGSCRLVGLIEGLNKTSSLLLESAKPETIITEGVVDGTDKAVRRIETADKTASTVEQALAATCLLYAEHLTSQNSDDITNDKYGDS